MVAHTPSFIQWKRVNPETKSYFKDLFLFEEHGCEVWVAVDVTFPVPRKSFKLRQPLSVA